MKKTKRNLVLCAILLLLVSIAVPMYVGKVYAADKNEVTLNFVNSTKIEDGKVFWGNNYLKLKKAAQGGGYTDCDITENNMKIDLNEFEYYLSKGIMDENPEGLIGGHGDDTLLFINGLRDYGQDFYLDTNMFIGELNIELRDAQTPPPGPSYPDNIFVDATFDGFGMNIRLNGERIGHEAAHVQARGKGYATGNINNLISITLAFGDGNIGNISVNGKNITIPEGTTDMLEFTVAPASEYRIVVTKKNDAQEVPRTIIWESNRKNNTSLKENELLKNGTVEILDILDENGESLGLSSVKQDLEKINGWAEVIPGSKVIFKLKPDYGYQLTSIKINDENLVAKDEQLTFEYTMPDTNVHICGIFEKVADKVNVETKKVKSGSIKLGENEINLGTVVLSVNDVNLSQEQRAKFEETVKEYEVSTYLNISLDQIIYKGVATDVWSNELKELSNVATITLQLENGVDGDVIVIVHEKNDGTYEIIPTVYNATTNTITFKTSSFSNYAIASKTVVEDNGDDKSDNTIQNTIFENNMSGSNADENANVTNSDTMNENVTGDIAQDITQDTTPKTPKAGDNVVVYSVLFVVAVLGIARVVKNNIKVS